MNKKGQIALISGSISAILTIIVWILLTPILNAITLMVLPNMGTMTAFFVKIIAFFVMFILILKLYSIIATGSLFGSSQ